MSTQVKTAMDNAQNMIEAGVDAAQQAVAHTANRADELMSSSRRATAETEASIQAGLRQVREAVPAHLNRAAHRAEDLARAGIDKARAAGSVVANKAHEVGERTTDYVRQEPAKALLMAAAAGAAATLLVTWAARRRHAERY